jgi:hypothetical protein
MVTAIMAKCALLSITNGWRGPGGRKGYSFQISKLKSSGYGSMTTAVYGCGRTTAIMYVVVILWRICLFGDSQELSKRWERVTGILLL